MPERTAGETRTRYKRLAAERAVELVRSGMVVGLGTGTTARFAIRRIGELLAAGTLADLVGVSTSAASTAEAERLGIPLVTDDWAGEIDLVIDGADEVDPRLDLIKGYGGALVRERIVAAASAHRIILVGPEKLVPVLGSRGRLPVEVVPFSLPLVLRRVGPLAGPPTLRTAPDGRPFVSDNGNYIVDCAVGRIEDPARLARDLRAIPGVVDCGLFLGTADLILVGEPGGARELRRGEAARA